MLWLKFLIMRQSVRAKEVNFFRYTRYANFIVDKFEKAILFSVMPDQHPTFTTLL